MFSLRCILIAIGIFAYAVSVSSHYDAIELFVIPWGDGPAELVAYKGYHHVDPNTPEDPTDDYGDPGSGPNDAFVDCHSNVINTCRQVA
jgi:hypothetical protein